jgi:flagellar basal body-associated protein FliL
MLNTPITTISAAVSAPKELSKTDLIIIIVAVVAGSLVAAGGFFCFYFGWTLSRPVKVTQHLYSCCFDK